MKKWLFIFSLYLPLSIAAQKDAKISMNVSSDTIGLNNTLEVTFTVENAKVKKFNPPSFDGFDVQGPSTSTSMSIINGDMTQSATYTFYLTPREKGTFKIGSASITTEGGTLQTKEKEIIILENFDAEIKPRQRQQGLWDDNPFFMPEPRAKEKSKKKYETEKI